MLLPTLGWYNSYQYNITAQTNNLSSSLLPSQQGFPKQVQNVLSVQNNAFSQPPTPPLSPLLSLFLRLTLFTITSIISQPCVVIDETIFSVLLPLFNNPIDSYDVFDEFYDEFPTIQSDYYEELLSLGQDGQNEQHISNTNGNNNNKLSLTSSDGKIDTSTDVIDISEMKKLKEQQKEQKAYSRLEKKLNLDKSPEKMTFLLQCTSQLHSYNNYLTHHATLQVQDCIKLGRPSKPLSIEELKSLVAGLLGELQRRLLARLRALEQNKAQGPLPQDEEALFTLLNVMMHKVIPREHFVHRHSKRKKTTSLAFAPSHSLKQFMQPIFLLRGLTGIL